MPGTKTYVIRTAILPTWVANSASLRAAWPDLDTAPTEAELLARYSEKSIVHRSNFAAKELEPLLTTDCQSSGISIGCCGALANTEVVKKVAEDLAQKLQKVQLG